MDEVHFSSCLCSHFSPAVHCSMWTNTSCAVRVGSIHLQKPLGYVSQGAFFQSYCLQSSFHAVIEPFNCSICSGPFWSNVVMVIYIALSKLFYLCGLKWWAIVLLVHCWNTFVGKYSLHGCHRSVYIRRISEPCLSGYRLYRSIMMKIYFPLG